MLDADHEQVRGVNRFGWHCSINVNTEPVTNVLEDEGEDVGQEEEENPVHQQV